MFESDVSVKGSVGHLSGQVSACQPSIRTRCAVQWAYRMRSRGKAAMKPASTRIGLRCQLCSREPEVDLGAGRPGARHGETDCPEPLLLNT